MEKVLLVQPGLKWIFQMEDNDAKRSLCHESGCKTRVGQYE